MAFKMISEQKRIEAEQLKIALRELQSFLSYANESNAWILINTLESEGKPVTSQNIREMFGRLSKGTMLVKNRPNLRAFINEQAAGFPYRGVEANYRLFAAAIDANPHKSVPEVFQQIRHQLGTSAVYEQAWREFRAHHPDIVWNEAITQRLDHLQHERIVNGEWPDEDAFVTADALEQLLPQVANELSLTPQAAQAKATEHQRQALVEKIIADAEPLRSGTGDREAERAKAAARAAWIEKVKQSELPDLERIRDKQQLRSGSSDGARQIIKGADSQRQQELYDGRFAPLPLDQDGRALYKVPGKEISVPLTYALWKRLPVSEMQRLLKFFGEVQINSVIHAQLS